MTGFPTGTARVWPEGSHLLRLSASSNFETSGLDLEVWRFGYTDTTLEPSLGEPPRVTLVEAVDEDMAEVRLYLDAGMVPGLSYTVRPPATGSQLMPATAVIGLRRAGGTQGADGVPPLLDIDAPFIRPDGAGGDFTATASGDWALSSGLATVEKLIWARLLEPKGSRYWAPSVGEGVQLKGLRPIDVRDRQTRLEALVQGIPGVSQASVQLTWNPAGEMRINVRARTDFGRLETAREVV